MAHTELEDYNRLLRQAVRFTENCHLMTKELTDRGEHELSFPKEITGLTEDASIKLGEAFIILKNMRIEAEKFLSEKHNGSIFL